jgi:hypothetical protein
MVDVATPPVGTVSAERLRHGAAVVIGFTLLFAWLFASPLFSGRLLAESDLFDQYLPLFQSPALVWSSFEFGGVPAFADPENSAFYPVRWIFAHVVHSWNGFIVSAFVLAGCFTYAYLYFHTRSRAGATVGALGFVLSEAMLERVPHANILHAVIWVPLLLLAIDGVRVSRGWRLWLAVAACAGASCVLAGHPQLALYAGYLCATYALIGLFAERAAIQQWLRLAGAAGLALLLSAVVSVPLFELSKHSVRQTLGFAEFLEYANSPSQMISILFPAIAHHRLEAPTYVGLLTLLLAAVGAARLRTNWRIGFWLVVAIAGLMLGAGDATPIARLVFTLPLYDQFRIVSRHLIFASLALNVLSAFGFAAILTGEVSRRVVTIAAATFAGVMLGGALLLVGQLEPVVWIQLSIGAASLCALMAAWRYSGSLMPVCLVVVLLGADLLLASSYKWTAGGLAMVTVPPAAAVPSERARDLAARLAPSKQRFAAVPDSLRNDVVPGLFARTWAIPTVGGYTSLLLKSVSDVGMVSANGRVDSRALAADDVGLDLLAVKYLIARADLASSEPDAARWRRLDAFQAANTTDRTASSHAVPVAHPSVLYENEHALPRVWLAAEVLPTTDGVMADAIRTSQLPGRLFDPRRTALVFEGDLPASRYEGVGAAEVTSVDDARIAVNVSSPGGGFLVLSEAYYPGWHVRVDDGPLQAVHRTDLALQGATIPAGAHVVTFEFSSETRQLGLALSGFGMIGVLAVVVLGVRQTR